MAEIALLPSSRNAVTLVDDEDFARFGHFNWTAFVRQKVRVNLYAGRGRLLDGRPGTILLHRLIVGARKGEYVDHINGHTLDNRRANLRLCTAQENARNRRPRIDVQIPFKGVTVHEGKYLAQIHENGKAFRLGRFDSAIEAAHAYDRAALARFGQFAHLNFEARYG